MRYGIKSTQVFGVKEGKVYKLQRKPPVGSKGELHYGSMLVTYINEKKNQVGEKSSQTSSIGSKPLKGKRELHKCGFNTFVD